MSICPNCGNQNADDMKFCFRCGKELPKMQVPQSPAAQYPPQLQTPPQQAYQQYPPPQQPVQAPTWQQPTYQQQPYPQPAPQYAAPTPERNQTILILAVIAVVAIVIIAVLALVVLSSSGTGIRIDSYSADPFFGTGLVVQFTVHATNTLNQEVTRTIICSVTFNNGDSYSQSLQVTMTASQTMTYFVYVTVLNFTHYAEVQNENWANTNCVVA